MVWTKIGSSISSDKVWDEDQQKEISGKYLGKKEKSGKMSSDMYVLEVGGENVGIWGCAVLDSKFAKVNIGDSVKIEFLGKEHNKNTGRNYKNYDFFVDLNESELPTIEEEVITEDLPF